MKTLKWFSLEWSNKNQWITIFIEDCFEPKFPIVAFKTINECFNWLEQNKYIERTEDDNKRTNSMGS